MHLGFDVVDSKKIRVIIDTDAACEADDPFAIVQGLLSPKLIVKGIVAEHFACPGSVEASYREMETIVSLMNLDTPLYLGQTGKLCEDDKVSEGVHFIIDEAMTDSEKPLFVLCQGAITNVAKALLVKPEIQNRMTIVWIGTHGSNYGAPIFREFNSGNDVEAANYVLSSGAEIWLIPSYVYTTITIGLAEIERRIAPCGEIGRHLFENMVAYNLSGQASWTQGESWSLGDSPAIAVALNPGCGHFDYVPAPVILEDTASKEGAPDRPLIRIYRDIDSRYILEDLIAKLEIFAQKKN